MDTPVPATGPIAPGTALSPDATGGDLMDMDVDAMMLLQHVKKWQDSVNRGSGSSLTARGPNPSPAVQTSSGPATGSGRRKPALKGAKANESEGSRQRTAGTGGRGTKKQG
ncbi:hypothetical protein FS749_004661 [Ceratobasidium sp. UAMH 11750]|nr:hypothetical protein FS749_004661 [Ceratobasidium sp. UAMH 11750]